MNNSAPQDNDRCWKCNIPIPHPFQLNSALMLILRPPTLGDVSICAACGAFHVFDGLLRQVKPSLEQMQAIMNTPKLMELQAKLLSREGM